MATRAILVGLGVPALLAQLWWAPPVAFALIVSMAGAIAAWEYGGLTALRTATLLRGLCAAVALAIPFALAEAAPLLPSSGRAALLVLIAAGIVVGLARWAGRTESRSLPTRFLSVPVAAAYAAALPGHLILLRASGGSEGMTWVCLALAATWGGDIGGYLVGRGLGRRPLAPVLSPHKTVEGAVGGLATSLLIGGALVAAGLPDRAVGLLLALILAASLAGQAGDLFESSLKRHRGIKDSSHLLGAQGGMLDCLDGLCFAAPLLQAGRMALG